MRRPKRFGSREDLANRRRHFAGATESFWRTAGELRVSGLANAVRWPCERHPPRPCPHRRVQVCVGVAARSTAPRPGVRETGQGTLGARAMVLSVRGAALGGVGLSLRETPAALFALSETLPAPWRRGVLARGFPSRA